MEKGLINTVNITKSSLNAFTILENSGTIDAEYQRISKLKTPKTRHKHWSDLLKQIEQYEGYYHDCKDFYLEQIQFIKGQILNNSQ